ncbi:unnamed protein product [Symbiodinium natans]|uniref:Tyr recombinase domain-containing protein n=1 Tax=Symbiodinium natans TaxID=878477 RepID=A0A812QN87_9DINO|nr:unnamed protein product [Symbiodinium natans]
MAPAASVPCLDSLHLPPRGDVGHTATRHVGASLGSAVATNVPSSSPAPGSSRTPATRRSRPPKEEPKPEERSRSRTPARTRSRGKDDSVDPGVPAVGQNFDLSASGFTQKVYEPGPLRDLQLKGGPRMLRWQGGPNLAEHSSKALFMEAGQRYQKGLRMGPCNLLEDEGGRKGPGDTWRNPGSGLWACFGPSNRAALQVNGKGGSHRKLPDFTDALRKLGDDRKLKATLGPSPALFAGPSVTSRATPSPATRTRPPLGEACRHLATKGAKFNKALDVARNKEALAEAVRILEGKFFADSNKAPQARKEADVLELMTAIASGGHAFPLTPKSVIEFGATLLSAGYKSAEQTFDITKRALGRDKAKANRAPEFQVEDFPIDAAVHDLVVGELAFPTFTYCLALAFMLRLCELVLLTWEDLEWDDRKVTLRIKKSKTDQAGKGVRRTLGCTCRSSPATCPVELVKNLAAAVDKALPGYRSAKAWVACSTEGLQASKEKVVASWSKAASTPLRGHSPLRSGAMFYVRAGLSIAEVTYLGRWHSDLVFQYGEEAWEGHPMNEGSHRPDTKKSASDKQLLPQPKVKPALIAAACEPHTAEESAPAQTVLVEELQTEKPKWVRATGRSKVVHLLGKHAGNSSASWKTKCGWPFARACHFTLYLNPPPSVPKCKSCRMNLEKSRGEPDGLRIAGGDASQSSMGSAF